MIHVLKKVKYRFKNLKEDVLMIVKDVLDVKTDKRVEIVDVTPQLESALIKTGMKTGVLNVFSRQL
jgi:thiamine phosphate synthase YjbQ (UPF0047 family)